VPISNIKIVGDNTITAVVTPPAMGAGPQPADRRVASRAIAADTALAAGNTTVTAYLMLFGTEPAEGSNMAWTTAQLLRAPQIWFQNASTSQPNRVISTSDGSTPPTQSTVVGQQIKLTTRPASLPNGLTISKNVWTLTGTTIDGYKASTGGSSVQPTTSTEMAQTPLTIYWPYPSQGSTFQVTYQYCVDLTSGRKCSETATAQFDVSGGGMMSAAPWKPTPPLIDLTIDQLIQCVQQNGILVRPTTNITFAPSVVYGNVTGDNCGFVNMGSTYGITFTPSGSPPKGTYTYVQLLDFDDRKSVNRVKGSTSGCITEFVPGVDKIYPYKGIILGTKPPQAEDAPADSLGNGEVESGSFIATMFLMWTSKTKNSIPVPIGYQTWGFSGGAHQDASGTWIPTVSGWPPPGTIGGFVPDWGGNSWDGYTALQNGYPIWSGPGGCS